MTPGTIKLLTGTALALSLTACVKDPVKDLRKKADKEAEEEAAPAPESPVSPAAVESKTSTTSNLDVRVELRPDGMFLEILNIPADATLECDLDNRPLVPCHSGALFMMPDAGDHKVSVTAMAAGQAVAFGESEPFTVLPARQGSSDDADDNRSNALALELTTTGFTNGMTHAMTNDLKFTFRNVGTPDCEAKVMCSYDSRTSLFWSECSADGKSFTVSKDLMASGLQFLSVQTTCEDKIGPIMTLFWYGVPEGWAPLMLKSSSDTDGRHVISLIKDDDCPQAQQKFECALPESDEFALCESGNVIDKPAAGSRVRLSCDGKPGPALTLGVIE